MATDMTGFINWQTRLEKAKDMPAYTDEWWAEMADSMEFLPKEMREFMLAGMIQSASCM